MSETFAEAYPRLNTVLDALDPMTRSFALMSLSQAPKHNIDAFEENLPLLLAILEYGDIDTLLARLDGSIALSESQAVRTLFFTYRCLDDEHPVRELARGYALEIPEHVRDALVTA